MSVLGFEFHIPRQDTTVIYSVDTTTSSRALQYCDIGIKEVRHPLYSGSEIRGAVIKTQSFHLSENKA